MMLRILAILFVLVSLSSSAATRISLTLTITNIPVTGNSNVINGSLRQWTNATAASTILTNLTSKNAAATNLFSAYSTYPVGSGIQMRWLDTNQIQWVAPLGVSLSGSAVGGWASSVLATQSGPSTFTALWPLENITGETNRTNQGSTFIYGLGIYSTNAFPTNATALSNFVTKGATAGPQYITSELRVSGNINNGTGSLSTSNLINNGNAIRSNGSGGNSLQVGSNAVASGSLAVAIGNSASASAASALAVGTSAIVSNAQSVAIGNNARTSGETAVSLGADSVAGDSSISVGFGSQADGGSIAIGTDSLATGLLGAAIGNNSVSDDYSVAIGTQAIANNTNSVAIGWQATTTADNQVMIGASTHTVNVPGVFAPSGTVTNATLRGTNVINGRIDFSPGSRTTLANGYNSGTILGTNVYLRMSGPSAAYTNAGFAAAADGTYHILQFDNPGLSYTILPESGLEATAANRVLTGTGALVNSTNHPALIQILYDGAVSRWRLISIR